MCLNYFLWSKMATGHFEEIGAWSQILQIMANSTPFYLSFDNHDSPGSVVYRNGKFLALIALWVYKNSKHEFCVFAYKHALWCKSRSSLNENCHWWWQSTQIELFWDLSSSFSMYLLLSTQEHTIPLCVEILQICFD